MTRKKILMNKSIVKQPATLLLIVVGFVSGYFYQEEIHPKWQNSVEEVGKINLCFTPGTNCQQLIVNQIEKAEEEILVEAYGFTSAHIAEALVAARKRGVRIEVIADRVNIDDKHSKINMLRENNIKIYIDRKRAGIAHNKIMIIDSRYVLTGSYNWTNAAQKRNTENLLLIDDIWVAEVYKSNWRKSRNDMNNLQ